MKFDCYIFDLDGTLLNLGNIGAYADQILVETLIKLGAKTIPSKKERRELWFSGQNFQQILKKWGISVSTDFWKCYDQTDFEKRKILLLKKEISLYKDAKNVLEQIYNHKENKKLAICTNTAHYIVNFFLKYFKINNYFHEIFSMGDNNQEFAKPSPKGILAIMKKFKLNSQKNTIIMIGDSIHDIQAAKAAKVYSCLINHLSESEIEKYKTWNLLPDYIIENLNDVIDLS
jgi:HAD superfamily hydrolase (TIGR01549 family)